MSINRIDAIRITRVNIEIMLKNLIYFKIHVFQLFCIKLYWVSVCRRQRVSDEGIDDSLVVSPVCRHVDVAHIDRDGGCA